MEWLLICNMDHEVIYTGPADETAEVQQRLTAAGYVCGRDYTVEFACKRKGLGNEKK